MDDLRNKKEIRKLNSGTRAAGQPVPASSDSLDYDGKSFNDFLSARQNFSSDSSGSNNKSSCNRIPTSLRKKLRINKLESVLLHHSVGAMRLEAAIHPLDLGLAELRRLADLREGIGPVPLGRLQLLQLTVCKRE